MHGGSHPTSQGVHARGVCAAPSHALAHSSPHALPIAPAVVDGLKLNRELLWSLFSGHGLLGLGLLGRLHRLNDGCRLLLVGHLLALHWHLLALHIGFFVVYGIDQVLVVPCGFGIGPARLLSETKVELWVVYVPCSRLME